MSDEIDKEVNCFIKEVIYLAHLAGGGLSEGGIRSMPVEEFVSMCFRNGINLKLIISQKLARQMIEKGMMENPNVAL